MILSVEMVQGKYKHSFLFPGISMGMSLKTSDSGILAVVTLKLHAKMYKGILLSADHLIGNYWKQY